MPEPENFTILSGVKNVTVIARGRGVQARESLEERYGGTHWRKMKGIARIEDDHGWVGDAEIHW